MWCKLKLTPNPRLTILTDGRRAFCFLGICTWPRITITFPLEYNDHGYIRMGRICNALISSLGAPQSFSPYYSSGTRHICLLCGHFMWWVLVAWCNEDCKNVKLLRACVIHGDVISNEISTLIESVGSCLIQTLPLQRNRRPFADCALTESYNIWKSTNTDINIVKFNGLAIHLYQYTTRYPHILVWSFNDNGILLTQIRANKIDTNCVKSAFIKGHCGCSVVGNLIGVKITELHQNYLPRLKKERLKWI